MYYALFFIIFVFAVSIVLLALKYAILALEQSNEPLGDKSENPSFSSETADTANENKFGRIKDRIEEIREARTVLIYCSLFFIALFGAYSLVKGTSYESHVTEWMNLIIRWMHVVFGIAWIGASFYFVFVENALNRTKDLKEGIAGNLWAIHGGGIYYLEKYKTAPTEIPKDLHWFKYESYFTWLSGFTLLIIVYYLDAPVYLIDPQVMVLTSAQAIAIGIGSMLLGWIFYDTLCKSRIAKNQALLSVIILLFVCGMAWLLCHVFSSRAAYIHIGALLGTIMAANVFRIIIPSQKEMMKAAKAGKAVDPIFGKNALLRSRHNNYFTLPVIFIMISNHFPGTYGSTFNWIVLIGLMIASALIKHYLNLKEQGDKSVWILPAGIFLILAMAFITRPVTKSVCRGDKPAGFAEVNAIIQKRCVACHSANPTDNVFKTAPNNILFDKKENILKYAERINQRAVITKTMPQANKTAITQEERDIIACWIENGARPE